MLMLPLCTRNPDPNQMSNQVYAVVLGLALFAALAVNICRAHALPGAQHSQGRAADPGAACKLEAVGCQCELNWGRNCWWDGEE